CRIDKRRSVPVLQGDVVVTSRKRLVAQSKLFSDEPAFGLAVFLAARAWTSRYDERFTGIFRTAAAVSQLPPGARQFQSHVVRVLIPIARIMLEGAHHD